MQDRIDENAQAYLRWVVKRPVASYLYSNLVALSRITAWISILLGLISALGRGQKMNQPGMLAVLGTAVFLNLVAHFFTPTAYRKLTFFLRLWAFLYAFLITLAVIFSGGLASHFHLFYIPLLFLSGLGFSPSKGYAFTFLIASIWTLIAIWPLGISGLAGHYSQIILTDSLYFICAMIALKLGKFIRSETIQRATYDTLVNDLGIKVLHLNALNEISFAASSLETDELLDKVIDVVLRVFRVDAAAITLWNEEEQLLQASKYKGFLTEVGNLTFKPGEGITGQCFKERKIIKFFPPETTSRPHPCVYREEFRSGMAAPIIHAAKILGVLSIFSRQPHRYSYDDENLLLLICERIGTALENARLYREVKQRAYESLSLYEAAQVISSLFSVDEVLKYSAAKIVEITGAEKCVAAALDEDRTYMQAKVVVGEAFVGAENYRISLHDTIGSLSLKEMKPLVVENGYEDPRVHRPTVEAFDAKSFMIIPIISRDRVYGAYYIYNTSNYPKKKFSAKEVEMAEALAKIVGIAVDNLRLFEDVQNRLKDLTRLVQQRDELLRQLREEKNRAEEAAKAKSEFLANISHEFRTPLNSIIGYAHCLIDGLDGPINEEQAKDLKRVLSSADSLLKMVDNILEISRAEAGKLDIAEELVDCRALVQEVVSTVTPLADAKNLTIKQHVAPDLPPVYTDGFKVKQILTNFLSNAVKFTSQGNIKVEVFMNDNRDSIVFKVADTGIGIEQEALPHIFEPFTQADGSITRRYGGSGLGLAISKKLVEALGGTINVESVPGKGSVFCFTIPAKTNKETR